MWNVESDDSTARYAADSAMYRCMKEKASQASWFWQRWFLYWAAKTYFKALVKLGEPSFTFRTQEELENLTKAQLIEEAV